MSSISVLITTACVLSLMASVQVIAPQVLTVLEDTVASGTEAPVGEPPSGPEDSPCQEEDDDKEEDSDSGSDLARAAQRHVAAHVSRMECTESGPHRSMIAGRLFRPPRQARIS